MSKDFPSNSFRISQLELWVRMRFLFSVRKNKKKRLKLYYSLIHDFWVHLALYTEIIIIFSRAVWGENLLYVSRGGIVYLHLSRWAIYRIVAIDVRSRREGRDLRKVGFYDPIKNQTYLNVPAILYFLEKGAQPTGTVHDILRKAELFKERTSS